MSGLWQPCGPQLAVPRVLGRIAESLGDVTSGCSGPDRHSKLATIASFISRGCAMRLRDALSVVRLLSDICEFSAIDAMR